MQNSINDLRTIDLVNGTAEAKRIEIREYFLKTWELDEQLYTQLKSDEVFYKRGDSLRHILLFYLGHTATFFVNKLFLAKLIEERIRPDFESIFAIGVDEMSWDDLDNNHYHWPELAEVREYRIEVKQMILTLIDTLPLSIPVSWEDPFWIIMMGIEHERIHIETSSVLIRQLPLNDVVAGRFGQICQESGISPVNELLHVSGAKMELGKALNHHFYGWDNEFGKYQETVNEFNVSKMLISNGEFLEFVEAGAYNLKEFWTEEGWNWRSYRNAEMPLFWIKKDDIYELRLVAEVIPMPWNWPVEVNYLEAKAYANWKSQITGKNLRLPTEAEWYRIYQLSGLSDQDQWKDAPGNIHLSYFSSPCPVDTFKQGDFYDVVGNVWQWTETPITGFPGFKVHPMYDDFSTPTFDGKHNLIKGGSWISTGNEAAFHARYAFRRHFYQHAGFRLVESDFPLNIQEESYEKDHEVADSCENSWNYPDELNFHVQLAQKIQENIPDLSTKNVLDLNCDTGRLAMELALSTLKVTGIDFSARFIRMPIHLLECGFLRYIVKDENDLVLYRDIIPDEKYLKLKNKLLFMQDNPNNLKELYSGYDLIVLPQLLEQLSCPIIFLKNIHKRLNSGGYIVIASEYDWEHNHISHAHRPGGFKKDGEPVTSFEGIKNILTENFKMINSKFELPLYKRINSRKTEIIRLEVSIWKCKNE